MPTNCVWITWEKQRRNKGISSAIGCELYEIIYDGPRIFRYIKSVCKTISILINEKPDCVVAQNPSFLLALTVVMLKNFFGYKSIIDAHNAGLFPFENKSKFMNSVSRIIQSLSDWTIVSNGALAEVVCNNNGRAIVLPDKLPDPPENRGIIELNGIKNLAFICSFSSDEPYIEVIEAAKLVPDNICIYITGRYNGKVNKNEVPSNVKLLGYIPEYDYWNIISAVDGIIVLTKREDCLVCGAYEAVALGKPMILSKTNTIMEYFSSGCVYTTLNVLDIKEAIITIIENKAKLSDEVLTLEAKVRYEWEKSFSNLLKETGIK